MGAPMTDLAVAEVASELYRAPLAEFVATRTLLAARLKKAGDPSAAAAVAVLRKPSVSTWLVDQLAAEDLDTVRELLAAASIVRGVTVTGRAGDGEAVRHPSL